LCDTSCVFLQVRPEGLWSCRPLTHGLASSCAPHFGGVKRGLVVQRRVLRDRRQQEGQSVEGSYRPAAQRAIIIEPTEAGYTSWMLRHP